MRFLKIFSLLSVAFLLVQCYPGGPEYVEELDIVYSNYSPDYQFKAKKTFAMPDKIVKIDGWYEDGKPPSYVSDVYANPMLNKIKQNMVNFGWTEVSVTDSPDVVITPAAWETTTMYYYDYYYYWDWWYGGYYPPGGWYYPYPVVEGYTTGSFFMAMVDPNLTTPSGKKTVVWTAIVNGLLEGSSASFTDRMTKSINQAFSQSQYLKIK